MKGAMLPVRDIADLWTCENDMTAYKCVSVVVKMALQSLIGLIDCLSQLLMATQGILAKGSFASGNLTRPW